MKKNDSYYFIVNGNAGSGKKKNIWYSVLKPELIRRGVYFRAYECSYPGHGSELAAQILAEHDGAVTLVVVGGDGTFNEVLNGITDFERVTIGFIPAGSANDLGFGLGISKDPLYALQRILSGGKIFPMDIGKTTCEGGGKTRYFAISSGVGLDAEACNHSNGKRLKALLNRIHLGKMIYLLNTVRLVLVHPASEAKLIFSGEDGELIERRVHRLFFIAGMNQPYEGGHIAMAPAASASDGSLSFAMAHDLTNLQALFCLFLLALHLHERIPYYEVVDARSCHIMLKDHARVHTDGESLGRQWDITIECLEKKLKLIL